MTNLKKSKWITNVGVDVSKWFLDIYIHEKKLYWQVENTPEGIKNPVRQTCPISSSKAGHGGHRTLSILAS